MPKENLSISSRKPSEFLKKAFKPFCTPTAQDKKDKPPLPYPENSSGAA